MDTPRSEVAAPRAAPGRWKRRLLWTAAGVLLLTAALIALAPPLASALARVPIERAFAERFQGRLEIESLDLAWGGRQSVHGARLFDPQDVLVARVELELPGLAALLSGRGKQLGQVRVAVYADLVADDAGRSNLERALAPRAAGAAPAEPGPGPEGGDNPLADLALELELRLEHLSWSDARTRASGASFVLDDFKATLALAPGGTLDARAAGLLSSGAGGGVQVAARVEHLFEAAGSPTPPSVDVELELADFPVGLIDALAAQGGLCTDLLGERATLSVHVAGTPQTGSADVELSTGRAELVARAQVEGGVLRGRDGAVLEANLRLPRAVFDARIAPLLPPGVGLQPGGDELHLRAKIATLNLPIAALLDARAAGGDPLASLGDADTLSLELDLGDWSVVTVVGAAPLQVSGVAASARLLGQAGTALGEFELRASLGGPDGGALQARVTAPDLAELSAWAAGTGRARAEAELELQRAPAALLASWTADGTLAQLFGERFDLRADVAGEYAANGAAKARLGCDLTTRGKRLTAHFDAQLPAGPGDEGLPELELRGELGGLEFLRALVPAAGHAAFDELLGPTLALELRTRPVADGSADIELSATGARTNLRLAANRGPAGLRMGGEQALELTLRPSQPLLAEWLAERLPAGARLELRDVERGLNLRVSGLDWPAPEGGAVSEPLAATLARARAEIELLLPALVWHQPPATGEGEAVAVGIETLRARASLAPASGLSVKASAQLQGGAADALDLDLALPRPAGLLAKPPQQPEGTLALRCRAIPTALVDALAVQDGLLLDVLGASLDLEFDARLPDDGAGLKIALRSPTASLDLLGGFADGALVARGEQGLTAELPLTPLYTKRIVGSLLPMAVGLAKPAGAPPAGLRVANFALPLDGDLRKLSADVHLDLSQVTYRVLPGFADLIASAAGGSADGARTLELPPLDLSIREGRVAYAGLPLTIGGERIEFSGTFDLVTRELDLSTSLRLSVLGEKVGAELAKARAYLDPNLAIPLRITGTPRKPRITIGREFLEDVVEQAAKGALQKGLGDLLERARKQDG